MNRIKQELTGTGKVYNFTLRQYSKSKANIIVTAIMLVLALASVPVISLIMGGGTRAETPGGKSLISAVWIKNDTGYELTADNTGTESTFGSVEFKEADFDSNTYRDHISHDEVFVELSYDIAENSYLIRTYAADNTVIASTELYELSSYISVLLEKSRLLGLGISEGQISMIMSPYYSASMTVDELKGSDGGAGFGSKFAIQYIYSLLFLSLSVLSSSYIIRTVIEEKDSKLVEILMVSVKPLALIAGKVLAVMTYVFLLLAAIAVCFALSWFISTGFIDIAPVEQLLSQFGFASGAYNLNPLTFVAVPVSLALGYLTISILTGISGACCTTMEDMNSAYMSVIFIVLFGYLVSSFTSFIRAPGAVIILSLFPVISVFTAPTRYIFGDIGFGILMLSWVIQILVVVYLYRFCSKVYSDLIIHAGGRIRLRELISMSRKGNEEGADSI